VDSRLLDRPTVWRSVANSPLELLRPRSWVRGINARGSLTPVPDTVRDAGFLSRRHRPVICLGHSHFRGHAHGGHFRAPSCALRPGKTSRRRGVDRHCTRRSTRLGKMPLHHLRQLTENQGCVPVMRTRNGEVRKTPSVECECSVTAHRASRSTEVLVVQAGFPPIWYRVRCGCPTTVQIAARSSRDLTLFVRGIGWPAISGQHALGSALPVEFDALAFSALLRRPMPRQS
jgi:hypothetical protein